VIIPPDIPPDILPSNSAVAKAFGIKQWPLDYCAFLLIFAPSLF
jgi:hypothetical protein